MGEQLANAVTILLVAASAGTWIILLFVWASSGRLLKFEPRLRPRWKLSEALLVFLVFHWPFLMGVALELREGWGVSQTVVPNDGHWSEDAVGSDAPNGEELGLHPVLVLIQSDPRPSTFVACLLMVAVVAPLAEEFVFRLVLLGYFLQQEKRWRLRWPAVRSFPRAGFPVALISAWFAGLHARRTEQLPNPEAIWSGLLFTSFIGLLAVATVIKLAGAKSGPFFANLGFSRSRFLTDVRLGAIGFLALTPPLSLLQAGLMPVFAKWGVVPDPIPIFALSVALGVLFASTGRITSCLILHMLHNLASFLLLVLSLM